MDQLDTVVIRSILHDIAASCLQTGTLEKMTSFSMIRKKTPFQKHREEEEAKKKVWGRGGAHVDSMYCLSISSCLESSMVITFAEWSG
jgi:hypothetical protein